MQETRVLVETSGTTGEETTSYWFDLPIDVAEFEEKLGVGAESGDYRIIEKVLPFADEVHEHTSVYQLNELDFMYRQLSSDMQEEYVSLLTVFENLEALYICRNVITVYHDCKSMIDVTRQKLMNDPTFKHLSEDCQEYYFDFEAYAVGNEVVLMIDDMAVYIANLGKYNEGYLVGAWFTFPIDEEDVKEKIGLNEQYEEYAIHDTDNFPIAIGEYVSIEELNEMYEMIEELPDYIVECLDEFISHYGTLEEVVEHKDDIYYYPDCETMTDVAYYYIDELQALGDIPPSLQNYIDYEAYGRDLDMGGYFIETSRGMCEIPY